ncbi:MAG: hypothetical protein HQL64_15970, partial [Magnetococcales bacterium]|nr:hypothetical protein [Magnetococcales bacterium]
MRLFLFLISLLCSAWATAAAPPPLKLTANLNDLHTAPHVALLEDPGGTLSFEQVRDPAMASRFQAVGDGGSTHRGGTSSAWWVRLEAVNPDAVTRHWMLQSVHAPLDFVDAYHITSSQPSPRIGQQGDHRPMLNRPHSSEYSVFPLETPPGATSTVYLRLAYADWGLMETALSAWSPENFAIYQEQQGFFYGLYFGGLAFMLLYNLFIYLSTRNPAYFWYLGFIAAFTALIFAWQGFGYRHFYSEYPWISDGLPMLLLCLAYPLGLQFARVFLETRSMPRIDRLFRGIMYISLLALLLVLVGWRLPASGLAILATLLSATLPLLLSSWMWYRGRMQARLYAIGSIFLSIGIMLSLLRLLGLLPITAMTIWGGRVGFWLQAAFLSLALVDQVNLLRRQRDEATRREQETLHRTKIELEETVAARTRDLHLALQEADRANQAKSLFLATMSHEIRTPLHGILGMAELLEEVPLNPEGRGFLRTLLNSGRSLLAIINDILDFSKIEAGRLELEAADFNLPRLLKEVADLFEGLARQKGLFLELRLHPNLPEWVTGDSARLRQVLANLLSNAVKFTPKGMVVLAATPLTEPGKTGYIRFEVRDSGIGIAPENLSRLFKLFEQLESSTSRRFGGTGLGLAICRRLVELLQGEIQVE